jgi:hypothetical protein
MPTKQTEVTLAQVLAKLVQRDDEHHTAWQEITRRQADHGRLLESVQVDLQRMGRVLEAQSSYNERQIKLAEKTQEHAVTFERAFGEIKNVREDMTAAVTAIGTALTSYREKHDGQHDKEAATVTTLASNIDTFKGAVKMGSIFATVVFALIGLLVSSWRGEISKNRADIDANTRDINSLRIDAVRAAPVPAPGAAK